MCYGEGGGPGGLGVSQPSSQRCGLNVLFQIFPRGNFCYDVMTLEDNTCPVSRAAVSECN